MLGLCAVVLTQYRRVTDGRTDGQTDGITVASTALAMRALRRAVKTAETIKLSFAFRSRVGPMNHVLHDVQMPTWEGTILREKQANHIGTLEVTFWLWARMGLKHHVLHGRSRSHVGKGNFGG